LNSEDGISEVSVEVRDSFGVTSDPNMPFLRWALDPSEAEIALNQHLQPLADGSGRLRLHAIHVVRYKRGRRCLVEYNIEAQDMDAGAGKIALLGKARARGLDETTYEVVKSLWHSGWGGDNSDGIRVPEPVGILPEFQMWLQRKIPGISTTQLLLQSGGIEVARRVAEAIHKLHQANTHTNRVHTMADELQILRDYLSRVAAVMPQWTRRIDNLLVACERLGASVSEPEPTGIHRDFYPDQVLVDGPAVYLLDLDLYCKGDPALDIGNFIGHIREMSLRTFNDVHALSDREDALKQRFIELSGCDHYRIQVYATLTVARHIFLSTQFLDRRDYTEALLEECERTLHL